MQGRSGMGWDFWMWDSCFDVSIQWPTVSQRHYLFSSRTHLSQLSTSCWEQSSSDLHTIQRIICRRVC